MAQNTQGRTPGPQQPGKYPGGRVGTSYQYWGEQPGLIYNPYTDRYVNDPKEVQAYGESSGLIQKPEQPSLMGQIGPAVGIGVTALAANEAIKPSAQRLGNYFAGVKTPGTVESNPIESSGLLGKPNVATTPTQGAISQPTSISPSQGLMSPSTGEVVPVGTAENGGTIMSDGTITGGPSSWATAPANGSIGQIGGALVAAKGTYDTFNGLQNGGEGLRPGLTQLGSGLGMIGGGPIGAVIGAGMGNLAGYGMQGNGIKNNLALAANPITWPLLGARLAGINLIHETTRQRTAKNTEELAKVAPDDPVYQAYVAGMREQFKEAPKGNPFHGGDYKSWDEYKKAGLDPTDLTGVYGNIKAYGPEWAKLTEEQRIAVTKANIDADNYTTEKGDVILKDEKKAQELKNAALKGFGIGATVANNGLLANNTTPTPVVGNPTVVNTSGGLIPKTLPSRSQTSSPGISNTGQRIQY